MKKEDKVYPRESRDMFAIHRTTFKYENWSNRCSSGALWRVLGKGTPQNFSHCAITFVCVCECDSREQLSAGRCTQQGAIRHGGVTHIKDAHTQTLTSMKLSFLWPMWHDNHKAGILQHRVQHGHCHMILTVWDLEGYCWSNKLQHTPTTSICFLLSSHFCYQNVFSSFCTRCICLCHSEREKKVYLHRSTHFCSESAGNMNFYCKMTASGSVNQESVT